MIRKFRKKPIVVEAVQITDETFDAPHGDPHTNTLHFVTPDIVYNPISRSVGIYTREGVMTGNIGDWIIKGIAGEFYACKDGIFKQTYEEVTE